MSQRNVILILTDAFDEHVDAVQACISAANFEVFRLNIDVNALKDTIISFSGSIWKVSQATSTLTSEEVGTVWCRKATVTVTSEHEDDRSNGFRIWRSEWNRVLHGFYSSIRNVPWLNRIQESSLADNKYYQLDVAKQIGLTIPDYITSNSVEKLLNFAQKNRQCAIKMMSQDLYRSEDGLALGIYVNIIEAHHLEDFGTSGENPITLQTYVHKKYEVRYTFVDDKHFVCRIDSQSSPRTSIDWRRYDIPRTPHSSIEPPAEVRQRINLLAARLGLTFGAADFIVDESDKWWFLEVNSNGQWLWIEDLTGMSISTAIADHLCKQVVDKRRNER